MKNRTNYEKLNHILHNPSQQDVNFGQDMQAKQHAKYQKGNAPIKRYVALVLVKLMVKKLKYSNTYNHTKSLTAKECNTNTLALLKSLESIKFITILKKHQLKHSAQMIVKLTPLGKKYIQKYIPRYKQIYHYLRYGKKSMKKSHHETSNLGLSCLIPSCFIRISWFIIAMSYLPTSPASFFLYAIIFWLTVSPIFSIISVIFFIISIFTRIWHFFLPYKNENINKDVQNATRISFINFLKSNNIREPDYRFSYNNNLPKIDTYLFK